MTGTTTGSRTSSVGVQPASESVSEKAQAAVGTATEKAKETGGELTHLASEQVGSAAHRFAEKADERKVELAVSARTLQDKLREFATSVGDEQPMVGERLEQVADSAGRLISYVEQTPVEEMTQDLNQQLRRHPVLFAAGLFGAGFAIARVLKPVDSSATGGARMLEPGSTQRLPAASPVNGGIH